MKDKLMMDLITKTSKDWKFKGIRGNVVGMLCIKRDLANFCHLEKRDRQLKRR